MNPTQPSNEPPVTDMSSATEPRMGDQSTVLCVGVDEPLLRPLMDDQERLGKFQFMTTAAEFYTTIITRSMGVSAVIIRAQLPDQAGAVLLDYIVKNLALPVVMYASSETAERLDLYRRGALLVIPSDFDAPEQSLMLAASLRLARARLDSQRASSVLQKMLTPPPVKEAVPEVVTPARSLQVLGEASEWLLQMRGRKLIGPGDVSTRLTQAELKLLATLGEVDRDCVPREQLTLALYGKRDDPTLNKALDSVVQRLRRKILRVFGEHVLITVYGKGHRFAAKLHKV